ncbi:MAG TPA: uracil-DNA glycosylase, partial [Prosthecobacter sp.]
MSPAAQLLKQHLLQKQALGVTHVALRPVVVEAMPEAAPFASLVREGAAPAPSQTQEPRSVSSAPNLRAMVENAAPAPETAARKAGATHLIQVPGTTREEKLEALRLVAQDWEPALHMESLRKTMVFAVGNPHASLMFVGEAPGAEEEKLREPFVGPAGQKLTAIIKAMGLDRSQVYISNICKFRPAMDNQGSGNRKPTAEEMRACLPFVLTEIDLIQPKVIVALGATAAEGLGIPGSVGSLRGR